MRIIEYIEPELKYRFGDEPQDTFKKSDTRRPRLTLKHLNKLRKIRQLRDIENQHRKLSLPTIYRDADDKRESNKGDEAELDASKPAMRSIKAKSQQQRKASKVTIRKLKEKLPGFS